MDNQQIIFIWDGNYNNYLNVCLQSLRLYNKLCKVNLFYLEETIPKYFQNLNINFTKINKNKWINRRLHHKLELTKEVLKDSPKNSELLVLDCDLLFQDDPFLMFKQYPNYDFYYTTCVMTLWRKINYCVNGGVKGYRHTENTIKFLDFWIDNNINLSWSVWKNYQDRHLENGVDWWYCQDFPNCVHNNELPFELKKIDVGYKFNYFTSTWGYFSKYLEMGSKIGNKNYVIIHFKSNFKDVYNINNPKIYNLPKILNKKSLITTHSHNLIVKKFLSRGENRYKVL